MVDGARVDGDLEVATAEDSFSCLSLSGLELFLGLGLVLLPLCCCRCCRADGFGQGTTVSDAPAYFGSLIKLFRSAFTLTELVTASVHREGVFFSSPKLSFIESFELHRPCRSNRSARYAMPPEVPRGLLDEPTLF